MFVSHKFVVEFKGELRFDILSRFIWLNGNLYSVLIHISYTILKLNLK